MLIILCFFVLANNEIIEQTQTNVTAVTVSAIVSVPISAAFTDRVTVSASVHVTVDVSIRAIVVLTVSYTVIVTVRVTASVTVKFAVDAMRRVFGRHAGRPDIFQSETISGLKILFGSVDREPNSTTDFFTKHLCSEEQVHGKEGLNFAQSQARIY